MSSSITSLTPQERLSLEGNQAGGEHTTSPGMHVVHLTSSRFFGGPERQMLELARELSPDVRTSFISFSEDHLCQDFLEKVRSAGFHGVELEHDTPRLVAAAGELTERLRQMGATILCVHGYKAGLLGLWAGRRCGLPVIAVSRGWTAENGKVRVYEWLDRQALRWMDKVICVSNGQAEKVRNAGVAAERVTVIHNAIRPERFAGPQDANRRAALESLFEHPPKCLIGAAGRLSPEKGFDVLIDACQRLATERTDIDFGVALFGEGRLRGDLQKRINAANLNSRVVLAGYADQFDQLMPHFDLFVQSSHTEGLPNVLLEASAAQVPVVATDVGGTAEVVMDNVTGLIVTPNDAAAPADGVRRLATDRELRDMMGFRASQYVAESFSFTAQAASLSMYSGWPSWCHLANEMIRLIQDNHEAQELSTSPYLLRDRQPFPSRDGIAIAPYL